MGGVTATVTFGLFWEFFLQYIFCVNISKAIGIVIMQLSGFVPFLIFDNKSASQCHIVFMALDKQNIHFRWEMRVFYMEHTYFDVLKS